MSKLTSAERKWLGDVQAVLNDCPSDRIGFFTTGDRTIYTWDLDKTDAMGYLSRNGLIRVEDILR